MQEQRRPACLVPVLGGVLQMYCLNRAGLVLVLGGVIQMYCLNRAGFVPVLGGVLQMHCLKQAGLVPVWGGVLQMYCLNCAGLVPVLGGVLQMCCSNRAGLVPVSAIRSAAHRGMHMAARQVPGSEKAAHCMALDRAFSWLSLAAGNHGPRVACLACACCASGETSYGLNLRIGCKCL